MNDFLKKFKFERIFTYNEFLLYSKIKINKYNKLKLNEREKMLLSYSKLNLSRSLRIQKTYRLNPELVEYFNKIKENQLWLVITEDWCGDSAQNIPYIYKYVENHPKIDFKVILRDENLEFVDNYFKNGSARGIPKIILFNSLGKELFRWGPRPAAAQKLVNNLKKSGIEIKSVNEKLHL